MTPIKNLALYLGDDGKVYACGEGVAYSLALEQSAAPVPSDSITLANSGNQITLEIGPDGDLWVSQQQGPNEGKRVDVTYGQWR